MMVVYYTGVDYVAMPDLPSAPKGESEGAE
jgi:hypothetical protein